MNLITCAARENKLTAFAEAVEFLVCGGDFFQRCLPRQSRIIVFVVESVELGYCLDQSRLTHHRFDQPQPMLIGCGFIEAENRQSADQQRSRGHNQE